jgi:hypothetical protein
VRINFVVEQILWMKASSASYGASNLVTNWTYILNFGGPCASRMATKAYVNPTPISNFQLLKNYVASESGSSCGS